MSRPASVDFAYYGKVGMGRAWTYFSITIIGILSLIAAGTEITANNDFYFLLGFVIVVFLLIATGVLVRAARKYATWKQWAEERGWEEPPKEERAWKAK